MLLKHDGDRLGIHFLRLREQTIRLRIVAHRLLVKALLCESAGFDRFVVFPPAIRHDLLSRADEDRQDVQTVAPICQGANSAEPKSYCSLFVRSPEATRRIRSKIR